MKRALPALFALVIAVLAFLGAFGVNTALRMAIALPEGSELETVDAPAVATVGRPGGGGSAPARPAGLTRQQYVKDILARNIFDHTKIGQSPAAGCDPATDPNCEQAITDLNVKLIATLVAEPVTFSSALIAQSDGTKAMGYGIGDKLQDAEIVAIEQRKVSLRRGDGRVEILTMEKGEPGRTQAPSPGGAPAGDDEGIEQVSDTSFTVDRSLIDKYLTDIEAVSRMARAIPHRGPDGEIDGYRLSGIRRNSPLSKLGIRNGDVIHGVNGQSLTSMQDAMGAYQSLQSSSSFTFEVTRRGQKQTMEYSIR